MGNKTTVPQVEMSPWREGTGQAAFPEFGFFRLTDKEFFLAKQMSGDLSGLIRTVTLSLGRGAAVFARQALKQPVPNITTRSR